MIQLGATGQEDHLLGPTQRRHWKLAGRLMVQYRSQHLEQSFSVHGDIRGCIIPPRYAPVRLSELEGRTMYPVVSASLACLLGISIYNLPIQILLHHLGRAAVNTQAPKALIQVRYITRGKYGLVCPAHRITDFIQLGVGVTLSTTSSQKSLPKVP